MTSDAEPWEVMLSRYVGFLADADHEEDLIAVLRGHLYIEIALTELLQAHTTAANKLHEKTTYGAKVSLAKQHSLLDEGEQKMLYQIGLLRNRFGHLPIKTVIDFDDVAKLEAALPARFAKAAIDKTGETFYRDRDPNLPSTRVRIMLRVVFNWLSSRAAHEDA